MRKSEVYHIALTNLNQANLSCKRHVRQLSVQVSNRRYVCVIAVGCVQTLHVKIYDHVFQLLRRVAHLESIELTYAHYIVVLNAEKCLFGHVDHIHHVTDLS